MTVANTCLITNILIHFGFKRSVVIRQILFMMMLLVFEKQNVK